MEKTIYDHPNDPQPGERVRFVGTTTIGTVVNHHLGNTTHVYVRWGDGTVTLERHGDVLPIITDDGPDLEPEPPRRGGRRPGAGRPPLGEQKRTMQEIYLSPATWHAVSSYRTRQGNTTSTAIEALIIAGLAHLGLPTPPTGDGA